MPLLEIKQIKQEFKRTEKSKYVPHTLRIKSSTGSQNGNGNGHAKAKK